MTPVNNKEILIFLFLSLCVIFFAKTEPIGRSDQNEDTRRILQGHEVTDTKPYMVYLRPATAADPQISNTNWLCGGVIIHERYILTSAACIEDVKHFYVVSGTNKWVPSNQHNECIKYGAKRAIWKCVPQNYNYDGAEFDNIRWMSNDIAVVKVEDNFNFQKRVKGCDFIPTMIAFNNYSEELEKPKTAGNIAGWGSTNSFAKMIMRSALNSPVLLETDVILMSKKSCKRRWEPRYHRIIEEGMICVDDITHTNAMRTACSEQGIHCKELVHSDEEEDEIDPTRRFVLVPDDLEVHSAAHHGTRRSNAESGGFCENDHGGPLVVGRGKGAVVVGVISACLARNVTKKCYGPFLYTSVWKNRHLISCTIDKEIGATCKKLLRTTKTALSETTFNWSNYPDG